MHPATRKLLQDEVKRSLGAAAATRHSWQALRWPFLVMGGGFAALLVMLAVINTQMRNLMPATAPVNQSLSKANPVLKKSAPVAEGSASPAPVVASTKEKAAEFKPPAASPAIAAGSIVAATATAPALGPEAALTHAATPAQPSSVGNAGDTRLLLSQAKPLVESSKAVSPAPAGVEQSGRTLAETPSPLTPAAPGGAGGAPVPAAAPTTAEALGAPAGPPGAVLEKERAPAAALSAAVNRAPGVTAGEFVQIHAAAQAETAQSPLSNILSSFRLQRSGQNVRIVDADGSVYEGQVLSGNAGGARLTRGGGSYGMARARKDTDAETSWSFKVIGTNNHLQQYIVFTGNVLGMPATPPPGDAGARTRSAPQVQTAPASAPLASAPVPSAPSLRITGKVRVGDGKEYEIEAKPPEP
jgi:hypothetical protein